eukprot:comp23173_c0_seq1/m.37527 comp23173_c0_seq1/g.37527  ORF comp23173_c0_seq1/g.37527 comp23173_c0_seq1/m.37527 type:complete len:545 (-) comp23173_c0_seq1:446-2080(-)
MAPHSESNPSTTPSSVIVVGGGVFGLSTALSLCKRGVQVSVFDRSKVPAPDAASTDITKIIRLDYGSHKDHEAMCLAAMRKWRKCNVKVDESERDPIFNETAPQILHETGVVYLSKKSLDKPSYEAEGYESQRELSNANKDVKQMIRLREETNNTTARHVVNDWAVGGDLYADGYLNPNGGWGASGLAVEHLAKVAREWGIKIYEEEAGGFAEFIERDGAVTGIITTDGTHHTADLVVVAAGAWTPYILGPPFSDSVHASGQPVVHFLVKAPTSLANDMNLPPGIADGSLAREFGTEAGRLPTWAAAISETGFYGFPVVPGALPVPAPELNKLMGGGCHEPPANPRDDDVLVLKMAWHGPGYLNLVPHRKRADGTQTEGLVSVPVVPAVPLSFNPEGPKFNTIPMEVMEKYRQFAKESLPAELKGLPIAAMRMCWYCDSFDGQFYIDYVPNRPGLFVCSGDSGHGFKFTPIIGDIAADVITGTPNRFASRYAWREKAKVEKVDASNQPASDCRMETDMKPTVMTPGFPMVPAEELCWFQCAKNM